LHGSGQEQIVKVAVTGASGFIGGAVMRGLRERGHEVIGLSRRGPDLRWDIAQGPLRDPPAADAMIHCAALVRDGRYGPAFTAVNVEGTRNVLTSFPGARFVHISSASIYDPWHPKREVREDAPPPRVWLNGYGATKYAAEVLVAGTRPDAVILRPHAVYGRGDITLLPRLLRARLGGRQLSVGDGKNRITLTNVNTLVAAVAAALDRPAVSGPINVGDPDPPTVAEVLSDLLRTLELPSAILWIPRPVAWRIARACEWAAGTKEPLLSRYVVNQVSLEFTLDLERARRDLGLHSTETYQRFFATALAEQTLFAHR
jgi:2-alkyl-3-oxoalkanoate reductase